MQVNAVVYVSVVCCCRFVPDPGIPSGKVVGGYHTSPYQGVHSAATSMENFPSLPALSAVHDAHL